MKIAISPMAVEGYLTKPGSLTYKNDVHTMLYRIKQLGYEGIEGGTMPGYSNEEYKALLDEIGLQSVSAGHLDYFGLQGDDFSKTIEECKVLGAKNVMIGSMHPIMLGNPVELKRFIANLNRAGEVLAGEGITLSYHNHAVDFSKINGKRILDLIVEGTDERYVFFEPDTHWIQAGGGHVITWLKKLRGRMRLVHFKDYAIDPYSDHSFLECTHKLFAEVGEGNLNWPGIIAECLDQGIEWCSVEQDKTQRPGYESCEISINNLRKFGV
ncbi:MAG: sugar phosphate isomerase/epimerase [Clostridia bacterium]|nr:sugar phosphate isomerase/epimerase [Clostridia bacterium]